MTSSKTKSTVLSREYVLDHQSVRHVITATSAGDLSKQVLEITGSKNAAALARAAWGDQAADITALGIRIVATGATIKETWRILPPLKGMDRAILQDGSEGKGSPPSLDSEAAVKTGPGTSEVLSQAHASAKVSTGGETLFGN